MTHLCLLIFYRGGLSHSLALFYRHQDVITWLPVREHHTPLRLWAGHLFVLLPTSSTHTNEAKVASFSLQVNYLMQVLSSASALWPSSSAWAHHCVWQNWHSPEARLYITAPTDFAWRDCGRNMVISANLACCCWWVRKAVGWGVPGMGAAGLLVVSRKFRHCCVKQADIAMLY